ncbi:DUF58 domain-containing protein [Paenibacillus caui]|uniref:DUF58 domain-containing protein n=1 Tax=Paenibacillus caui TaxID=2873927 RepID=UPI001CA8CFEC|nr:DUF58 domain-containing protein [Paenibacillus caui]
MNMTGIWTAFCTVWLLALGLLLWHGGPSVLFVLSVLTFMMLQGAAAKWAGPRQLSVRRNYSAARPLSGERVDVVLSIAVTGGLPPLWLKLRDGFGGMDHPEQLLFAGFRRNLTCAYTVDGLARGIHGRESITAANTDLFGWFSYSIPCTCSGILPVLPRSSEETGAEHGGNGISGSTDDTYDGITLPGPPGSRIRSYEPGDPLKSIYWKGSARRGDLVVYMPEEENTSFRLVLLDTERNAYSDDLPKAGGSLKDSSGTNAVFERAVSAAASVLEAGAEGGHTLFFRHGGMESVRRWNAHSDGEDGPVLLAAVSLWDGGAVSCPEMLYEAVREYKALPVTVITGSPSDRLSAVISELAELGHDIELISCASRAGQPAAFMNGSSLAGKGADSDVPA